MVEDRERNGPFGSLLGLDRVPGVGDRLLERMAPHLAFSGRPADLAELADTGRARRRSRRGVAESPAPEPRAPMLRAPAPHGILSSDPQPSGPVPPEGPAGPPPDVLNSGTVADLDRLPGIGPARARRIVVFRDSAGPFRTPHELARVPGISLALARRLWSGNGVP